MRGKYRERTYTYEILQVNRQNGEVKGEDQKEAISRDDLRDADQVFFTVQGGHLGDEMAYRWVAGPFENQRDLEDAITDMMLYGSP